MIIEFLKDIVHLCLPHEGQRLGPWHWQILIAPAHFFFDVERIRHLPTDVEEVPLRTVEVDALELQSILQGKEACQAPLLIKRRGDGSGDGRTRRAEGGQGAAREDRAGGRPLDETVGVGDLSYFLAGCRGEIAKQNAATVVVDGIITY